MFIAVQRFIMFLMAPNLFYCRNVINMFATAEGLLTQQDSLNSDGLQEVFATNLFGHFLLVHRSSKFVIM